MIYLKTHNKLKKAKYLLNLVNKELRKENLSNKRISQLLVRSYKLSLLIIDLKDLLYE